MARLPAVPPPAAEDWLVRRPRRKAGVFRTDSPDEIALDNGLVRRTLRVAPNGATVGLDDLMGGRALLRGVKPEAWVELDGRRFAIGGLAGQPNYAYLTPAWVEGLVRDPGAFQLVDFEVGVPAERMAWKRVRHHAPDVAWPPLGVSLRMDYRLPPEGGGAEGTERADGRDVDWMLHVNPFGERRGLFGGLHPLPEQVTRRLTVGAYYTGLTDTVPPEGMTWYEIR